MQKINGISNLILIIAVAFLSACKMAEDTYYTKLNAAATDGTVEGTTTEEEAKALELNENYDDDDTAGSATINDIDSPFGPLVPPPGEQTPPAPGVDSTAGSEGGETGTETASNEGSGGESPSTDNGEANTGGGDTSGGETANNDGTNTGTEGENSGDEMAGSEGGGDSSPSGDSGEETVADNSDSGDNGGDNNEGAIDDPLSGGDAEDSGEDMASNDEEYSEDDGAESGDETVAENNEGGSEDPTNGGEGSSGQGENPPVCYNEQFYEEPQTAVNEVSIMIIKDTSGSMNPVAHDVANKAMQILVNLMNAHPNVDFKVGVLSGHLYTKWAGEFIRQNKRWPEILSSKSMDRSTFLTRLRMRFNWKKGDAKADGGEGLMTVAGNKLTDESIAEMQAKYNFFSKNSVWAVLFLSDEDDFACKVDPNSATQKILDTPASAAQAGALKDWNKKEVPWAKNSQAILANHCQPHHRPDQMALQATKLMQNHNSKMIFSAIMFEPGATNGRGERDHNPSIARLLSHTGFGYFPIGSASSMVGNLLVPFANRIDHEIVAKTRFPLAGVPAGVVVDPASVQVTIDGNPIASVQFSFLSQNNTVVVEPGASPGQNLGVTYCAK